MRDKKPFGRICIAIPLRIMAVFLIATFHLMMAATPIDSLDYLLKACEVDKNLEDTQSLSDNLNAIATIY